MENKNISIEKRKELLGFAHGLVDEARVIIQEVIGAELKVSVKTDRSLVTAADIKVEEYMRERIENVYPDHGVEGEELGLFNGGADFRWIIDPVDGTEEFVYGVPTYGVLVALFYKNLPVVAVVDQPALGICIVGGSGIGVTSNGKALKLQNGEKDNSALRMIISKPKDFVRYDNEMGIFQKLTERFPNTRIFNSAYIHTSALHGSADVVVNWNSRRWDVAPSEVLVPEVGGKFFSRLTEREEGNCSSCAVFGNTWAVDRVMNVIDGRDFS